MDEQLGVVSLFSGVASPVTEWIGGIIVRLLGGAA